MNHNYDRKYNKIYSLGKRQETIDHYYLNHTTLPSLPVFTSYVNP